MSVSLVAMTSAAQATVFTSTGLIQIDTITQAGIYDVTAIGTTGVDGGTGSLIPGGSGASIGGYVFLPAGTVLEVVAGS